MNKYKYKYITYNTYLDIGERVLDNCREREPIFSQCIAAVEQDLPQQLLGLTRGIYVCIFIYRSLSLSLFLYIYKYNYLYTSTYGKAFSITAVSASQFSASA